MAKVQIANVAVLDNPSPFLNPFQFEVTFECIEELKEGKFRKFIQIRPGKLSLQLSAIPRKLRFRLGLSMAVLAKETKRRFLQIWNGKWFTLAVPNPRSSIRFWTPSTWGPFPREDTCLSFRYNYCNFCFCAFFALSTKIAEIDLISCDWLHFLCNFLPNSVENWDN